MMFFCPFCGRRRFTCWPEFWPWQYQGDLFCSENCWICDATRKQRERNGFKMSKKFVLTKEQMEEAVKKYKEEGRQAAIVYLDKLGSKDPMALWNSLKKRMNVTSEGHQKAKKPGMVMKTSSTMQEYKQAMETPEAHTVDIVETPENVVKVIDAPQLKLKPGLRGLNNSDFTVSAIKHPQLGEFYYDKKFNSVDWRSPEGEEISLHPAMWKELYMIIPDVMGILQVVDGDE